MDDEDRILLLNKMQKLMDMDYETDEECDILISEIERHFSDPEVSDYMLRSNYTSAEEVMKKALEYKPICLPDQSRKD